MSGRRLNPRKADLLRWREDFAAQLRAHGIEANASSRLARLKLDRGDKRSVIALKARGDQVLAGKIVAKSAARTAKAQKIERARKDYYALAADVLSNSEDASDQVLGKAMAISLGGHQRDTVTPARDPERER